MNWKRYAALLAILLCGCHKDHDHPPADTSAMLPSWRIVTGNITSDAVVIPGATDENLRYLVVCYSVPPSSLSCSFPTTAQVQRSASQVVLVGLQTAGASQYEANLD